MKKLKITDDARNDMQYGAEYYENKQINLGHDFLDKVEEALHQIKENPNQFPKIYKEVRKCLTGRFPYKVLFVIKSMKIIVFAVFHNSRNPNTWKNRIDK